MAYLNVRPCLLVSTRHDAGAISGTLFSSGDTASDESDTLGLEVFGSAVRVGVVRVAAINDDIALLDATLGEKELDEVVDRLSGHDEHHHTSRLLELLHKFLDGVRTHDGLALSLCYAPLAIVNTKFR